MIKVYPVIKAKDVCEDYAVFLNGKKIELNTARVSAYPFNRRWPGHQRQIEQTELVNFISMEADETVEIKIVPKIPSLNFRIRPRNSGVRATINCNGEIELTLSHAGQYTVEPYGRNHALHIFVDPVKDYGVNKDGENILYFGAGEHDVGDLYLKSGQTVFIDEGAVVYATVYGKHVENVKILGRGILDNSKNIEKILFDINAEGNEAAVDNADRQHAINFVCCKNVEIDGITIRDSLVYNINSLSCEKVNINNVKIIGCWRYNSDGVHFANCRNSSLTNSFLRTYDDSICVRGFANYDYDTFLNDEKEEDLDFYCENILVKNCVVWNDWGKNLQVGTETFAKHVKNVVFEDCKLIHTTGLGLTIWLVDNAVVSDIKFKNTDVEYDDYLLKNSIQNTDKDLYFDDYNPDCAGSLVYFDVSKHFEYSLIKTEEELGKVDGVVVDGLNLYSVQKPVFSLYGYSLKSPVKNVVFKNVYWNGEKLGKEIFDKNLNKNEFAIEIYYE